MKVLVLLLAGVAALLFPLPFVLTATPPPVPANSVPKLKPLAGDQILPPITATDPVFIGEAITAADSGIVWTSSASTFAAAPTYNCVKLSSWLQLHGKPADELKTVSIDGSASTFAPSVTIITSKHEPVVTKHGDGTWTISFR